MYTTLVDPQTLHQNLADPDWIVVDCRFDLADTDSGRRAYELSHIPGAIYAHLDDDLSGPPVTDHGRHPLPTPEALTVLFSRLGINEKKQVVVYDGRNGGIAARLWWLLRYMGHTAVAVIDGGWGAWPSFTLSRRTQWFCLGHCFGAIPVRGVHNGQRRTLVENGSQPCSRRLGRCVVGS